MTARPAKPLTGRRVLVWFVAFFGVVFAVNAVMIKFALDTMPGLEVESAYRASLAFNGAAQAAQAQAARGWQVDAHVERDAAGRAAIRVSARDRHGVPLTALAVSTRLSHPADKRLDRSVGLDERETGIYHGTADALPAGQWDLVIEAERSAAVLYKSRNRVVLQ